MSSLSPLAPSSPTDVQRLLQHLDTGGLAVLPTDTVPGLAASAAFSGAAARLASAKGSPNDRPFSLHLRSLGELRALVPAPPPGMAAWLTAHLPGPWTVVLPKAWVALPSNWDWPWDTVGIRLPDSRAWAAWAAHLTAPLFMTSVNDAGQPPVYGAELEAWVDARPDVLLAVDPTEIGEASPSTVVAFDPLPRVLRDPAGAGAALRLPGQRVLCVCTGNTCRSPLAEALLRRELAAAWGVDPEQLPELGWEVRSAGTMGLGGAPASDGSLQAGAEHGLDLRAHRSASLEERLAQGADLILGMTESHLAVLPPGLRAELFDPTGRTVPDPFGGPIDLYRQTLLRLQEAAEARVRAFSAWPESGQSSVTAAR